MTSSVQDVDNHSSVIIPDDGVDGASAFAAPLPSSGAVASASVPSDVDLRDNQLDELSSDSQAASQSVLFRLTLI